jgi:hypothetical protein
VNALLVLLGTDYGEGEVNSVYSREWFYMISNLGDKALFHVTPIRGKAFYCTDNELCAGVAYYSTRQMGNAFPAPGPFPPRLCLSYVSLSSPIGLNKAE